MHDTAAEDFYVTTAIPYVNAPPHLGHALEFVLADVLARHRRARGGGVRFLTGTDDNALKNVTAARAAGLDVAEFVARNAARFTGLRDPLELSFDDVLHTSTDPRHRVGVQRLWSACAARGDFYRHSYTGRYCAGCEQFYPDAELLDGRCPEHGTVPETVTETNWFFRLSRYAGEILAALESGRLRVVPEQRRNEVLAFVRGGLSDFSVSRPRDRSWIDVGRAAPPLRTAEGRRVGWGIPVPGDPDQVIYVWWDALTNYLTALGRGAEYARWWAGDARRVHVIGKGILRFHAVYWPALLLSAGEPLPDVVYVHDYLTVDGAKVSKSAGNAVDPVALVDAYGVDAVRWWLLREVAAVGETDFTVRRLCARADTELANGIGNLANRTVALIRKYRNGHLQFDVSTSDCVDLAAGLGGRIDAALQRFDFRRASGELVAAVEAGNRYVERTRPWELGRAGAGAELDRVLAVLLRTCRTVAAELAPFLPSAAARLAAQLGSGATVGEAVGVFARLG